MNIMTRMAPRAASAPRPGTPPAPGANPVTPTPSLARPTTQFVPDAQYLAQAAQAQFARQTQINQITAEQEASRNVLQESVRRINQAVPEQRQGVSQAANKQGLFYSGVLGKRLGDLEADVARQRADIQGRYDSENRAREAARTAILQGASVEDAALKAEAVGRQIERDQTAAQANALAPTPVPKKKPPKSKSKHRKRKR